MISLYRWLKKNAATLSCLWAFLIIILCFIPANELHKVNIPLNDRWGHFILFGVLSFLTLHLQWLTKQYRWIATLLALILYGVLIEQFQGMLVSLGRTNDPIDALADAVGVLLGAILFWAWQTLFQFKTKQWK